MQKICSSPDLSFPEEAKAKKEYERPDCARIHLSLCMSLPCCGEERHPRPSRQDPSAACAPPR